jgi:hypothetical protein
MPEQKQQKGGGAKKIGRNKSKCSRYATMHIREKNKVRRVRQSNGLVYATDWATKHNVLSYLKELVK